MKIAATYENGNIFPHFGRTENFKIYEVENNEIVSSEIVSSGDAGHEALAVVLAEQNVDVLVCGGCGEGAQQALTGCGIEVCSGAEGDADAAVEAYLRGELVSAGVNCDHHDHDHEHEEGGCGRACGGGCSGCGGGCGGSMQPLFEGTNVGKTVRVHYTGTLEDGSQFDSSYDRGEPLEFICGVGMMITGFDQAVAELEPGQTIDVKLPPEMAYGEHDPNAVLTIEQSMMPGSENLEVGQHVYLANQLGQPIPVTVTAKDETNITFDANHELAGKELNFHIEMVEIVEE